MGMHGTGRVRGKWGSEFQCGVTQSVTLVSCSGPAYMAVCSFQKRKPEEENRILH